MSRVKNALTLRVLGGFGLNDRDTQIRLRPSARKLVALLAAVGAQDRSEAAARLFEDVPLPRAQGNLRTIVWRVNEDCPGLLVEDGGSLRIDALNIDFHDVSAWSFAVIQRSPDIPVLPRAAGKDLLPSWGDTWLIEPREHLHLLQVHALESAAERFLLAGRFGEASDCALRAVTLDPLRESAVKLLVEVLIREGNVADALVRYRRFAQTLQREVNAEPGVALKSLVLPLLAAGYTYPRGLAVS